MFDFRLDRFLTLYFFHPISKYVQNKFKIPILMYHSISEESEDHIHPYYRTNTSPAVFAEHMRFLSDNDYSVIDLKKLKDCFEAKNKLTKKFVVITFDDGYRNFYTKASPILQEYHYPATIFLPTDYIGKSFQERPCLTWVQVRELKKLGYHFGSHTATHPKLYQLSMPKIREELTRSKTQIEDALGENVSTFSYPFRFPEQDLKFVRLLKEEIEFVGYKTGVTTIIGCAEIGMDQLFLKRLPANSFDDSALLDAKLKGSYDFMHVAQYAFKAIKNNWID
ncbi:MAG: polysaccharide deacetylase family protein [Pseudomonadota bacterium]